MRIVSINTGRPREVVWRGETVLTAIFKTPVAGPLRCDGYNLDGDGQADLTVHGGADKAVYAYPTEHYAFWRKELPDAELSWGAFGENFSTEGLREETTCIGDVFQIGSAKFVVTQPRMPCFKLGIRFNRPDMVKRFLQSGRTGFYMGVIMEGDVCAGDTVNLLSRGDDQISVSRIIGLHTREAPDRQLLRRAIALPNLPKSWCDYFRQRLDGAGPG